MYKSKKIFIFTFIINMIFNMALVTYAENIRIFKAYSENNFSSAIGTYSDRFEVFDDLRFFEIHIKNKTSIPFVLSIKNGSPDGEEIISKIINGNNSEVFKNTLPLNEGTYYFTITSLEKNTEVNGCISVDLLTLYRDTSASANLLFVNKVRDENLSISIGSEQIEFLDAQPFVDKQGRTQVPVRAIAEILNCKVDWQQDAQTAVITRDNGDTVKITLGSDVMTVNEKKVQMDTAAIIRDDRIFIPIRFVAEALGLTVNWIE